jgi:NAD-dependent DNA ligase
MGARQFIARLGIPMVQERTLKKLAIASVADFIAFADATYAAGRSIIEWKKDQANRALLESLLEALDIRDESAAARESVCMTGKGPLPRKELQARIEAMGYEFHDSITANTTILVCEDPAGSSSKLAKARKNGTRIVSYGEFFGTL